MEAKADRFYKDGDIALDSELLIQEYVQERVWAGDDCEINAFDLNGHNTAKHYAKGDVPLELVIVGKYVIQMFPDGEGFGFDLWNGENEQLDYVPGSKSGVKTIKQGVAKLIKFANYLSPQPKLRA